MLFVGTTIKKGSFLFNDSAANAVVHPARVVL
jgi:hypothetical protein